MGYPYSETRDHLEFVPLFVFDPVDGRVTGQSPKPTVECFDIPSSKTVDLWYVLVKVQPRGTGLP